MRLNLSKRRCFTRQIKQHATDDELLQKELIGNPDAGDIIQNTGGLRKIRMATGAQGKAAARVIYFLATAEIIYLVLAYPKSTKDNLPMQKILAQKLANLLKNERC